MQLQLRGDERRRELGVGGRAGARAPNLRRDVVQLLAVLVGDDGSGGGSRIGGNLANDRGLAGLGKSLEMDRATLARAIREAEVTKTYHDAAIIYAADNSRTGAGGLGQRHTTRV